MKKPASKTQKRNSPKPKGCQRALKKSKRTPPLLGEDSLIDLLSLKFSHPHPALIKGIGDDTSVSANTPGTVLLATTDTLVESTHFSLKNITAEQLGQKALNVSVSDIAAMGARPTFFLVSLVLPPYIDTNFVTALYKGISTARRAADAVMAGGNMAGGNVLTVSTTLFGEAVPDRIIYRSGATDGDDVYVTGTLGDSALGLTALKMRATKKVTKEELKKEYSSALKRHLTPTPRLAAGVRIAKNNLASAMIDISDGLALDAGRLAKESNTGIVINAHTIALSACMKRFMAKSSDNIKTGLHMALSGGEDYELLFTSDKKNRAELKSLATGLKLKITKIGAIDSTRTGVIVLDRAGTEVTLKQGGYTHF